MRMAMLAAGALTAALYLTGCATDIGEGSKPPATNRALGDITIEVDPLEFVAEARGVPQVVKVEISDIRELVHDERTTIGGVSMGRILLEPPATEIVRALVQAKADTLLARMATAKAPTIYVGIRDFHVRTPATLLYWDVTARIDLVLRVAGHDLTATGAKTRRTYRWPSAALVREVVHEALRQVVTQTEPALAGLLASP